MTRLLLGVTVGLAAMLAFGMEPLVGRMLLPLYGGAAHVWLTALMVFQGVLLAAYAYGHLIAARLGPLHLGVLLLGCVVLPLTLPDHASGGETLGLVGLLVSRIALPFFALSTTAVVMQMWHARSWIGRHSEPYTLYAFSNVGSILALLAYPFVVEPLMGLWSQRIIWAAGYGLFLLLMVCSWWVLRPDRPVEEAPPVERPSIGRLVAWGLLAGLPSAHLGAVTHLFALEIGSFPMVWVLPLVCYLGSFAVVFREGGGPPKFLLRFWPEFLALGLYLYFPQLTLHLVASHLFVFGATCLLCHGLLYERRPPASGLTWFYLVMAAAGWMGGASVALVAPALFPGLWEYPAVLGLLAVVLWCYAGGDVRQAFRGSGVGMRVVRGTLLVGIVGWAVLVGQIGSSSVNARYRTFYGTYFVSEGVNGERLLGSGRTLHGAQAPEEPAEPTLYYSRSGGLYEALEQLPSPRNIAMVGLGAGVTASYGRPGDTFVFVEIDGALEAIAREWFTFLDDSAADVRVVVGDARMVVPELEEGPFDAVLVDAFTGDGMPVHLLTAEALRDFTDQLTEDGILVLHLSSRYYDLIPTVRATARSIGLQGVAAHPDPSRPQDPVVLVVTREPSAVAALSGPRWTSLEAEELQSGLSPWTDDYINPLVPLLGLR